MRYFILAILGLLGTAAVSAQPIEPFFIQKPAIEEESLFGYSVLDIGDIDANGAFDVLVGLPGAFPQPAPSTPGEVSPPKGDIWTILMRQDGSVKDVIPFGGMIENVDEDSLGIELKRIDGNSIYSGQIIASLTRHRTSPAYSHRTTELFSIRADGQVIHSGDFFDYANFELIGDLDQDGNDDYIAISNNHPLHGQDPPIAQIRLFAGSDNGFQPSVRLSYANLISSNNRFALASTPVGDLDGDGISELALSGDGRIWLLSIDDTPSVKIIRRISGPRHDNITQRFGRNLAFVRQVDTSAILVVTEPGFEGNADSPPNEGAIHLVSIDIEGQMSILQTLYADNVTAGASISLNNHIDVEVSNVDHESGAFDLLIGAPYQDDVLTNSGAVHRIRWDADGSIEHLYTISNNTLSSSRYGVPLEGDAILLGDIDGNGYPDLYSGGNLWILNERAEIVNRILLDVSTDHNVSNVGDLNGDGIDDIVVGPTGRSEPPADLAGRGFRGWAEIRLMKSDGSASETILLNNEAGSLLQGQIQRYDNFGTQSVRIGDINNDGIDDLAIRGDAQQSVRSHAYVSILLMSESGRPTSASSITTIPSLADASGYGRMTLAAPGDIDGNGVPDLILGMPNYKSELDSSSSQKNIGGILVILLNDDGTKKDEVLMTAFNGYGHIFGSWERMGWVESIGDLNGDHIPELLLGPDPRNGGASNGLQILFLDKEGSIGHRKRVDNLSGPYKELMASAANAGRGLTRLWDMDGDGVDEIFINYVDGSGVLSGYLVMSLMPALSPEIRLQEPSQEVINAGMDFTSSVEVTDLGNSGISSGRLHFRPAGTESFFALEMDQADGRNWTGTIPGFLVQESGLEYYFSATSPGKAASRMPEEGFVSQPVYSEKGRQTVLPGASAEDGYRLLSVPMVLDQTRASTVLSNSMGDTDPTEWRFFQALNNSIELASNELYLRPGSAYWAISRKQQIIEWGAGTSLRTDSVFAITVPGGWTLFGSPFNFDLDHALLTLHSGNPLDIRRYRGAWEYHDTTLVPFEGYAIYNGSGAVDTLYIAPNTEIAELSGLYDVSASKSGSEESWSIPVHVQKGRARDIDNRAMAGASVLNKPDPPPVGEYVRLGFASDHGLLSSQAVRDRGQTMEWDMIVSSASAGIATVQFPDLDQLPEGYGISVFDPASEVETDLRLTSSINVALSGDGQERVLKLRVHPDGSGVSEVPTEFGMTPAFPNPFASATTIPFSLPESGGVSLTLYDMLGRRVTEMHRPDLPAGRHQWVWDGTTGTGAPATAGVYVARLRFNNSAETITLTKTR